MQTAPSRVLLTAGLLTIICVISGCTTETHEDDTTSFTFAPWVPVLVLLPGGAAFLVGILMRRKFALWGWVIMGLSAIACGVLAPALVFDKVTVNKDRFTLNTGFWFAPTLHDVTFADLSKIEVIAEQRKSRSGTSTSYYLVCYSLTGDLAKVPVGDLMKKGAAVLILRTAEDQGITVVATARSW